MRRSSLPVSNIRNSLANIHSCIRNNSIISEEQQTNIDGTTTNTIEELEIFFEDINEISRYGKEIFALLKRKLESSDYGSQKLKDRVEYFKERNNLLVDELLEYINEQQALPDALENNITLTDKDMLTDIKDYLCENVPLPESFIRAYIFVFSEDDWLTISKHQVLSIEFLAEFRHKVYWQEISKRDYIDEEYIRIFRDELYWHILDKHNLLTEELKKDFQYKLE